MEKPSSAIYQDTSVSTVWKLGAVTCNEDVLSLKTKNLTGSGVRRTSKHFQKNVHACPSHEIFEATPNKPSTSTHVHLLPPP